MSDFAFHLFGGYPAMHPNAFGGFPIPSIGIGTVAWLLMTVASYPAFWLFMRRAKGIPLRFNRTVCAAVISLGAFPLLLSMLALLNALSTTEMLSAVTTAETFLRNHVIVCQGDPTRVDINTIQLSKLEMANAVPGWRLHDGPLSISSTGWLHVSDPCDYSPVGLAVKEELALQGMHIAQRNCLIAVIVVGIIGLLSLYSLVTRDIATDIRATGHADRVVLTRIEHGFVAVIVTLLFFPFGIFVCRLFKRESSDEQGRKTKT